jgi:hypothetical protein
MSRKKKKKKKINFLFIVCQEMGGNCFGVLSRAFAGERVKRRFLISHVSAGNMLPASYRLGGPAVSNNLLACV